MAFTKQSRIKKKKDFERIFKTGSSVRNGFFLVKFLKNSLGYSRATVVVPVSLSAKAVARNRIKRVVAAALKNILTSSKTSKTDFIIIAQMEVKNKKSGEVSGSLRDILQKANIV
jgi:ribonuclease P protein component